MSIKVIEIIVNIQTPQFWQCCQTSNQTITQPSLNAPNLPSHVVPPREVLDGSLRCHLFQPRWMNQFLISKKNSPTACSRRKKTEPRVRKERAIFGKIDDQREQEEEDPSLSVGGKRVRERQQDQRRCKDRRENNLKNHSEQPDEKGIIIHLGLIYGDISELE